MRTITAEEHISTPDFLRAVDAHECALKVVGTDRILFSSDPFSSTETGRNFLDSSPLKADDMHKGAHGNAERLLKIPIAS